MDLFDSLSFVCPWNFGSGRKTEIAPIRFLAISSEFTFCAILLPVRSPWDLIAFKSPPLKPSSCVPPWGVGTVLQYELRNVLAPNDQLIAHSKDK